MMRKIAATGVLAFCLVSRAIAAENNAVCLAADAALQEARGRTSSAFVVLSDEAEDFRFLLDRDHFADKGDARDGFWGIAAPSDKTAKLFLGTASAPATRDCPGLIQRAHSLGLRTGHAAERQARRAGAVISVQSPILNQSHDEALLFVSIRYPGGRDATGWVYLLRKQADGEWRVVDRQFAFVS